MIVRTVLAAVVTLSLVATSLAGTFSISVALTGAQEVPPSPSAGTGALIGTYNDVTNTITFTLTFSGLFASTTAAHLHAPASPGVNAPVVIGFAGFPTGLTSGGYSNSYVLTATQETQLLTNLMYVNVHTTSFPGGELRAQLTPVCSDSVAITTHPTSVAALTGGAANFTVAASGSPAPVYQWRRNGTALSNGGSIGGATTNSLTITPLALSDNGGAYDCVVTMGCASLSSKPVGLAVTQRCRADFNTDGMKTVGDIFSFLTVWFAACP